MTIYKPSSNTDPTKALYGTQGADVSALQTYLNSKGASLAVDSKYGDKTKAAVAQYGLPVLKDTISNLVATTPNVTPTTPTPLYTETPAEKALREALTRQENEAKTKSEQDIGTEASNRAEALAAIQNEIDAQNAVYADKLASARVAGTGRLGIDTAIQGRSGLLGSSFGAAQTNDITAANKDIENALYNEKNAAIQALISGARKSGAQAYADKRAAKEAGLNEYIANLSSANEYNTKRANDIAKLILSGKLDFEKDKNVIEQAAKDAGLSVGQISRAYNAVKVAQDQADAEIAAQAYKNLPSSAQEYQYLLSLSPEQQKLYKQYQTEDANRKAVVAKAGNAGLTPYQQFSATQSLAKDTQSRTEKAREMARQATLIDNSYNNILNGKDRSLNTQAIIVSFNKILDPTSVVRESEYDRTAAGQALISRLEGKLQNILTGGAGVTDATIKEASDIAKQYLDGARQSIITQNKRAEQIAIQFGLNPSFVTSTYQDTPVPPKTLDDYRAEFPQATFEELQALMAEEQ